MDIRNMVYRLVTKIRNTLKRWRLKKDPRLQSVIEDLIEPPSIDWQLSNEDRAVVTTYALMFIRENDINVDRMKTSPDLYPELHRFFVALQGDCPWRETLAAYDYLESQWPMLKPLLEDAE